MQSILEQLQDVIRYPADNSDATVVVVLIVVTASILIATVLIAMALPGRQREHDEDSSPANSEDTVIDSDT